MRSSRIATLILSILIFAFSFKTNDILAMEVIPVKDGVSRHYLNLENEVNEILLQDLKQGETYKIFISSEHNNCLPFFVSPKVDSGFVLEFEAKASQQLISIGKTCNTLIEIRLSIACSTCNRENASRNPAGILVDENYIPNQLVRDVFIGGDCFDVEAQSISYAGNTLGRGYFSNGGSSINIEEGVILSTGNVHGSAGPNNKYNTGSSFFDFGGDVDLSQMINSNFLYDIAALEFDFTPTTDQISFEFVFASEEYCEYVNSSFNDVFGFFISGPGINGPFSNNAENIAIVPNTASYTAINTVNHLTNAPYYVNNIPVTQHSEMPSYLQCAGYPVNTNGVAINNIEYDGFTTVMTAMANVQSCETYHIKLIIADVADGYFDSAVFLKANSFSAGDAATVTTEALGGGIDANVVYENCEDGFFVFKRTNDNLDSSLTINFTVSGSSTATQGVDYQALPTSIVIPAGDSIFYLPVNVYNDLFAEGAESIILELEAPCSCEQPYVLMFIEDVEPLVVVSEDMFFCDPVSLVIQPQTTGGIGNYTYQWNTGDTTAMLNFFVDSDVSFTVTVTDECGNISETVTNVSLVESPIAFISGDELVCPESPDAVIQITFTGSGPWDIIYTIDNIPQAPISGITDNPFIINTTMLGIYELQSVSSFDCIGDVQGAASVTPVNLDLDFTTTDETCTGAENGSISITPNGGSLPYTYTWNNGLGNIEDPVDLPSGDYELILTDNNGCTMMAQITVNLDPDVPQADAGLDKTLDCNTTTITLVGSASAGNNYSYQWTTNDGNIISGANTLTPLIDQTGTYSLNVTNMITNCIESDQMEIFIDSIAPIVVIDVLGPLMLDCSDPVTTLDGSGSEPFGDLIFEWKTADGNILSGANTVNPEVNAGGTYELTVTKMTNGCTNTGSILIGSDMELPIIIIQPANVLTCIDSLITLQSGGSSSGANFQILWTSNDGNIISGENTSIPEVDQPGTYFLTIYNTNNDCENTASVTVTEDRVPPVADAGLPTEMDCNDDFITLDGSQSSSGSNFLYQWSTPNGFIQNGMNSLDPEVNIAGTYLLLVTNILNGCTAEDGTIVIQDPDVPNAADIEIFAPQCFGEEGGISVSTVYGGDAPYVYSIDGGVNFYNQNNFTGLQPGNVNVIIQDAEGCLYEEQVFIPGATELTVNVTSEVEINLGETYQINAISSIPTILLDTMLWTPDQTLTCNNCLDPVAFPLQTTTYQIMVTDENGCPALAEILVRVDKDRKIFIPNAFSPNGDGTNDRFMIYAREGLVSRITNFQVFNRWGGKVFAVSDGLPNEPVFGWDGTMKGETVNPAVFIYFAEIEFIDGEVIMYKGDVTVTN
ncbi:MAG: gliding motility-associated-like protein [Saprospiraceae bacterium]|jgi:gliding motility-associated-like protein